MPHDPYELQTELVVDPLHLYVGLSNHGDMASQCNSRSAVSALIEISYVKPEDAQAAVIGSEYAALTAVQRDMWGTIVGLPQIPVSNTNIRQQVTNVWSAGTTTRANLVALQFRRGSRAEQLWGEGVVIHHLDIAAALALPSA